MLIIRRKPLNPLSAKFIKWSNTLKQIVGNLPTICLSVFDHFSGLAFKGLILINIKTAFSFDLQVSSQGFHPSSLHYKQNSKNTSTVVLYDLFRLHYKLYICKKLELRSRVLKQSVCFFSLLSLIKNYTLKFFMWADGICLHRTASYGLHPIKLRQLFSK